MPVNAICEYCGEQFEAERQYCPQCGKQLPQEIKATLTIEKFEPDCSDCHALCCKALAFDWPHYKKPAGIPCKNLTDDFRCGIWDSLEADGYTECRSHDCYGAGQTVARFIEQQHPDIWRNDERIQQGEMAVFQKVYMELYADIHKRPPEVGNLDELQAGADEGET